MPSIISPAAFSTQAVDPYQCAIFYDGIKIMMAQDFARALRSVAHFLMIL